MLSWKSRKKVNQTSVALKTTTDCDHWKKGIIGLVEGSWEISSNCSEKSKVQVDELLEHLKVILHHFSLSSSINQSLELTISLFSTYVQRFLNDPLRNLKLVEWFIANQFIFIRLFLQLNPKNKKICIYN